MKSPIAILMLVSFLTTGIIGPMPAYAQVDEFKLPAPGVMVRLSPPLDPPILKGIKVHTDNPFRFDFILDKGDGELSKDQLKDESSKLIKYFLASLTIPEKDLWVNLSPYEKDRIIPNSFGLTEMGRDLLAEDYMLKQITASLIYPEDEVGKKFWKRIYEEAEKKFGTTNIPVNTFNKVWIVPEKAVVYENAKAGTAYVVQSKLKVMLEQDYLSLEKHEGIQSGQAQTKDTNQLGSQIVREIVIPELTKEVNENKNFAQLRQVYNSLILATWYKRKIKDSILVQVYADKNKVAGVNIDNPQEKDKIYQQYLKAFKKGVYNYIKEDIDPTTQETVPRKYFSGGFDFAQLTQEHFGISPVFQTIQDQTQVPVDGSTDNTVLIEENTVSATQIIAPQSITPNNTERNIANGIDINRPRFDSAMLNTGKVGKVIPGTPLKSQNEYNRDVERKEKFLKNQNVVNVTVAPGREGFEKFQPLYNEVRSIIDRLLIAQGLNPKEFQFFLADTTIPNAYAVNYYNTIVVNLGLIRMLEEYSKANNIDVTQDALAWVLAHEILHIMQNRREIDEGRIDEKKGIVDTHAEDRGKEYQSDLLALWLMDRGGFTVKAAPHVLKGIEHWLKARGGKDAFWGDHPRIEERLRKLEHQILTYHWQNQDAQVSPLQSIALSKQRTRIREFQERVINVSTASGLISLLNQATNIDELLFGMLIGFELLPDKEKNSRQQVQAVFEQGIKNFSGQDEVKSVLYEYMRDEIYIMLGLMREDLSTRLDAFKKLGQRLSNETILQILELRVPNLFFQIVDVDPLQKTDRHEEAETMLGRLNHSVTSLGDQRQIPSDRFNMYSTGFLFGLYTKLINDVKNESLELSQARRFLRTIIDLQNSRGYFDSMRFTKPLIEMVTALEDSPYYRSQLTPEDIKLIIQIDEILGTKINYRVRPNELAKSLYELAQGISVDSRNVIMEWLLHGEGGWNELRAEFMKLDIEAMFKGKGIIFQGNKIEYLENLLANENVVKSMRDVLKVFVKAAQSNRVSAEELVAMHKRIFNKFKVENISDDLGIFQDLWFVTNSNNPTMFSGDAFDKTLLENAPEELRPMLQSIRRELKPIFYVFVLGGIPDDEKLRNFVFGAHHVRERENENLFSNIQIRQMIESFPLKRGAPQTFDTMADRYMYLTKEDQDKVLDLWDKINPETRIENINSNEFDLIKSLLEYYRHSIGRRLSDENSTPDQQEEAFGKYAAPYYFQALLVKIGSNVRLTEGDVSLGSSLWRPFAGDISGKGVSEEYDYEKYASNQRPRRAVRFAKEGFVFDEFVGLFNFVSQLPSDFKEAVDVVLQEMPPSVFRNFVLHMLFVNRVLKGTGYASDNNSIFDLGKMQAHIAGLSSDERARILSAIAVITPHFVYDEIMEKSNNTTIATYWRDRYSKNAPKIDETAIRQQREQEVSEYDDMTYATPGGPVAQLYIFASRLADGEMKNMMGNSEISLASKREMIEKYYPQSSLARDRWIKAAIQAKGSDKTVDEIEKLLVMINNTELRNNLALDAFDQYRTEHPEEFNSLNNALDKIQRFFPEASLIRDDVLSETAQYLAKTRSQYEEVRVLYLDPFKKTKDLDLKETARTAMNQDMIRTWITNRSPSEKAHFLLWLMGITDQKPFFLVDFEYNFHVNADSLREDFARKQSKYYPLAGQSSQREALEPFLYGEKGIFNDGTAMSNLLGGMFDFLIKDGPNKDILKKVFDKVFAKADQSRREEIFLSLVWTLSLQRGESQNNQQNITPEMQEARAVRMFLESLGLVGRQLAQVLARSLWVTKTMRDELSVVQDSARKMDKGVVFDMLEKFDISKEFESIEEPLGSAKVAGVYRAKMRDGKIVAIKVKRPEVDKTIEADMKFLKDVFDDDLKAAFMAEGIVIPDNFIIQIEEGFRQELDFKQEARNTNELGDRVQRSTLKKIKEFTLRKLFGDTRLGDEQGDYEFYVPQIISVVNNSLIIMEYIDGVKLSSEKQVKEAGLNQSDIELAVANELLREVFYEGFYHGDPHLGNILIQKMDNGKVRIILIDAGASFSINKTNRRMLGKLMVAVRDNQTGVLEGVVQQLGGAMNEEIRKELNDQVLESKDSVGQKLLWFFHILEKNNVQMPNELLQIMRFFATGQALFSRGDSAMIDDVEKEKAADLDQAINRDMDEIKPTDWAMNAEENNSFQAADQKLNQLYFIAKGNGARLDDDLFLAGHTDLNVDPSIGETIDSHGIAKGSLNAQLRTLRNILEKGIDWSRRFDTAPLEVRPENKAGMGAALGTAGGTSYREGLFILASRPKSTIKDGIQVVLVNSAIAEIIPDLKRAFPKVDFRSYKDAKEYFREIGQNAVHLASSDNKSGPGGIDLTPANMNLQTQNGGNEIKFHLDPAMLAQLQNAPGFVPVIINIQPLNDLSKFLGITQESSLSATSHI